MKTKRIFLLEPNLVKSTGHPIEYSSNIISFCTQNKIEIQCVGNIRIDNNTKKKTSATARLHNTCFQNLEDNGKSFFNDLLNLDREYGFTQDDLILITTCYTNEIFGAAKYLDQKETSNMPRFALWLHQFFPPTTVFQESLDALFQNFWTLRLAEAFKAVSKKEISIWTTPSVSLNESLSRIAGRSVGILPNPCTFSSQMTSNKSSNSTAFRYAFLGDGRYEKGLSILIASIIESEDKTNSYLIQAIDLRGYTKSELIVLRESREKLETWGNVDFIDVPVSVDQFRRYIELSDVILLPYHPLSYDRRVSSVYIQSIQHGKPVLVSKNTWMESEMLNHGVGAAFEYDPTDTRCSVRNFINARRKIEQDIKNYRRNANNAASFYINKYSTESFFDILFNSLK